MAKRKRSDVGSLIKENQWLSLPKDVWFMIFKRASLKDLLALHATCRHLVSIVRIHIERHGFNRVSRRVNVDEEGFTVLYRSRIRFHFSSVFLKGMSLATSNAFLQLFGNHCTSVAATIQSTGLMRLVADYCPNLELFDYQSWCHVDPESFDYFSGHITKLKKIECLSDVHDEHVEAMEQLLRNNRGTLQHVDGFSSNCHQITGLLTRVFGVNVHTMRGQMGLRRWMIVK